MSGYLEKFSEAREIALPCLYHPPGTILPSNVDPRKGLAVEVARNQSRIKLRVSPHTLPGVERAVSKACDMLRIPRSWVHAFVSPETGRNALCMMMTDEPVIVFGSALVELTSEDELACVAGHEIGHFLLPEAWYLSDPQTPEGRIHCRASEITMDRIGLLACGDLRAACNTEMKLMSGLREPHLRMDVTAILDEARQAFDGTFRREEDLSHPPAQLRLRAIVEFAGSDACLRPWGRTGGTPIAQVNQSVARLLNEHIDRHIVAEIAEPLIMSKAWAYCLCRCRGQEISLAALNQVGPPVEMARLQKAWGSLVGFKEDEFIEHAKTRLLRSLENAEARSPLLTKELLVHFKSLPQFHAIIQILPAE